MPQTSYEIINSLDEVAFIAGTHFLFTFLVNDQNGAPIDLVTATTKWTLCPYGQSDFAAITKDGVISLITVNEFTVTLTSEDTALLMGKYIQQPIVIDFQGQEYRPSQGVVTIAPKINNA